MMHQILGRIKSWNREQILILLLAGVLLLVIALPTEEPEEKSAAEKVMEEAEAEGYRGQAGELEKQLQQMLAHVEGVGKAEVMLTLKSNGRKIVEKDTEQSAESSQKQEGDDSDTASQNTSRESTVFQKDSGGNETPYVTEALEPEIAGVLVIAQGAGNAETRKEITEAVMALFGVEAHKIKVMKME